MFLDTPVPSSIPPVWVDLGYDYVTLPGAKNVTTMGFGYMANGVLAATSVSPTGMDLVQLQTVTMTATPSCSWVIGAGVGCQVGAQIPIGAPLS